MTPKEDFQKIKNVLKDSLGTSISQETVNVELALTELEELKKRNEPMKPIHKYNTLVHINYEETINEYYCNCGKLLYISRLTRGSGLGFGTNGEKHQYCSHCGQRLDWSEKDGK